MFNLSSEMHVCISNAVSQSSRQRRNSSKNQIHVIFLAPFWNAQDADASKITNATDPYSVGTLHESILRFLNIFHLVNLFLTHEYLAVKQM